MDVSVLIVVPFVITYGFGDEITEGVPDSLGVGAGGGLGVWVTAGFAVVFTEITSMMSLEGGGLAFAVKD
jgi:hypothetical protein